MAPSSANYDIDLEEIGSAPEDKKQQQRAARLKPEELSNLIEIYDNHFKAYWNERKRVPKRKCFTTVWTKIMADLKVKKGRGLTENEVRQHQKALRSFTKELKKGTADPEGENKPALKDLSGIKKIYESDAFAKRCVLDRREQLLATHANVGAKPENDPESFSDGESEPKTKMSKAQQRVRYTEAIENLTSAITENSTYENACFQSQTDLTKIMIEKENTQQNRSHLKRKLEEIQIEQKKKETIQIELNKLLWLKNNGILSEEEFVMKCKQMAGV